jgi:hypothetical protein
MQAVQLDLLGFRFVVEWPSLSVFALWLLWLMMIVSLMLGMSRLLIFFAIISFLNTLAFLVVACQNRRRHRCISRFRFLLA